MNAMLMIAIAALCVIPVAAILISMSRLSRAVDEINAHEEPLKR